MKNINNCKKIIIPLLLLSLLTACKTSAPPLTKSEDMQQRDEGMPIYTTLLEKTPNHINDSYSARDKSLIINADITTGDWSELSRIKLVFNTQKLQELVDTFILERHPNVTYNSDAEEMHNWIVYDDNGDAVVIFSANENSGYVSFLDVRNEPNCEANDGSEHYFEYGYITNIQPTGIELTVDEATLCAKSFLEENSSLSFNPWNIISANSETYADSGAYAVSMQAYYKGLPICMESSIGDGIAAKINISSNGIYFFSGSFLWDLVEETPIDQIVPLESVIEKLKENFHTLAAGNVIEVNAIHLQYMPTNAKGVITVRPVWVFDSKDIRTEIDNLTGLECEIELTQKYVYYADTGTFCGLYY